jgi:hypothetical protein
MKTRKNIYSMLILTGILLANQTLAQPIREEVYYLPSPTTSDVRVGLSITPTDDNGLFVGETSGWYNPGGLIYRKSFVSKHWGASQTRIQVSNNIVAPDFKQYDNIKAVTKDAAGNLYAAGTYYYNDTYKDDAVLVKYSPSMVEQWKIYAFSSSGAPFQDDESIDVYAHGGSLHLLCYKGENGYNLIKYTDVGGLVFTLPITTYIPLKVKCNAAGEIYIFGYNIVGLNDVYITIQKLNTVGVQLWKKNFNAKPGNLMDNPGYFDVDAVGDVYFTSSSERVAGNQDAHLVKYSSTGTKLWAKYVAGTANTTDAAGKFCFDPAGNIYVAHTVTDINSGIQNTNIMIRKYSPTGAVLGTKYYRGSGNVDDEAVGIFYANNGRIYLGGLTRSTVKRSVMAQYDTGLNLEYTDIMLHPETASFPVTSQSTNAIDFIYDAPGNLLYWVGRQEAVYPIYLDYTSTYFILKYSIPTVPRIANFQNNFQLSIYPNPATDKLTIQSEENLTSVIIYDLQGRIVYQTGESDENSIDIDLHNFSPGTYITKITDNTGNSHTEKIIKL